MFSKDFGLGWPASPWVGVRGQSQTVGLLVCQDSDDLGRAVSLPPDKARLIGLALIRAADETEAGEGA